jgi:GNAT superfamily N-acetyltransferase
MRDIEIRWAAATDDPELLASFFLESLDPSYISHTELQEGRATTPTAWSASLPALLSADFAKLCMDPSNDGRIALAYRDTELVGLAVLSLHVTGPSPWCVLEDLIVKPSARHLQIGAQLIGWLEKQAAVHGATRMFLESGIQNAAAHRFFHRRGYHDCSIVMMKDLTQD